MSYSFQVNKTSGFYPEFSGIEIYLKIPEFYRDEAEPFYITNEFNFNLPAGKYTVFGGDLFLLPETVKFKAKRLPKREHFTKDKPELIVCDINTVAYMDRGSNHNIYIDRLFFEESSLPEREYVYQHELGHLYYNTETFCDLFAERQMLKMGYNPSQILSASKRLHSQFTKSKERFANSDKRLRENENE